MKIIWNGPVGYSGYGRITNFLVPALAKQGVDIFLIPAYSEELQIIQPELMPFVRFTAEEQLDADAGVRLSIANPSDAVSFFAKRRIFYTMLEADRIPPYWVKALNSVDQVWTPSHWNKEVFEKSGVKKEIKVVPGGVDLSIFNPYREPLIPKGDKFRFLFVGKWELRKGCDILVKAFAQEFKENEKVELILHCDTIKWFLGSQFNIHEELLKLKLPGDRADLVVVKGIIPDYRDMGRLYTSVDCFVCPTRGEGWNLPLIEAMASGLPCIATNWSAHTEFANKKNCYLLNNFKLTPVNPKQLSYEFLQYGKWAEPDIKELREKMRYVFDNQEEAKKLGQRAAKDMKKWTWDEAAKKAKKILEEVIT